MNLTNCAIVHDSDEYTTVVIPNAATRRADIAYLTWKGGNWYAVEWDDRTDRYPTGRRDTWAYVQDGTLFLPSDGQTDTQHDEADPDDLPDPLDHWYDPETGRAAIHGVPGAALARLI